jgi:hypothetical protein
MGMSRAEGKISMQKDLPVKYSGIMELAALPARSATRPDWSGMSGEHAYSVCVSYGNANYFGKDCGKGRKPIDRAVPEFRRSHERESAQIPRSQMVEFLTSAG